VFRSPLRFVVAGIWVAFAALGVFAVTKHEGWQQAFDLAATAAFLVLARILGIRELDALLSLVRRRARPSP
jgi:hypothetical protein